MSETYPAAYAVIVAGGSGLRMGAPIPKQFLSLAGKPMLYWSIKVFAAAISGIRIIIVLPQAFMEESVIVLRLLDEDVSVEIVAGGDTRYASVAAGLAKVPANNVIVLVHDAARPLVTPDIIRRCYECARLNGTAVPVIPVADSIRQISGLGNRALQRDNLRAVQTPQAFDAGLLKEAFQQPYRAIFTDEASVVEWSGKPVQLVDGAPGNFKVTTAEDLVIAEALLGRREVG